MNATDLPKVLESFRIGNRGEAYLEFIMSKHCLMHKIAGYKDIGIDYLCEWLVGNSPTRILFGIQVKTSDISDIGLTDFSKDESYNLLRMYKFSKRTPSWDIEENTIKYWMGFDIPLYLFFVFRNNSRFDCYYQRLSLILHEKDKGKAIEKIKNYKERVLYKANDDKDEFLAVIDGKIKDGGFARDLFVDSVRCSYNAGSVRYRNPAEFGLKRGWVGNVIYPDLLGTPECPYIENIEASLMQLARTGIIEIKSDWKVKIGDMHDATKKYSSIHALLKEIGKDDHPS